MKKSVSVLFLFLGILLLSGAENQPFALVLKGKSVCSFEIARNSPKELYRAVNHFNSALQKITGCRLKYSSKVTGGGKIVFALQKMKDLRRADQYEISFPDKNTLLIRGTLYSVQWALNDLIRTAAGAEWILPENCGLSYKPMKDVVIPRKKIVSKPYSWNVGRFHSMRTVWRQLHFRQDFRVDHDLTLHAFPRSKYGTNNSWPKVIFPVHRGKRLTAPPAKDPRLYWQPCYSNPEVARIAVQNLLNYLEANPDLPGLSLAVNDNGGYCECNNCMKMDKFKRSERSESYYTFVNAVAKEIAKKYPEKFISVLAYGATYNPPSFKLEPNVGVMLTIDIGSCVDPAMLKKHKSIIARWGKKASVLGIWEYSWGYPYPMPRLYGPYGADLLGFFYQNNGRFYCGESWTCDAHEGPKYYVISGLLRDHTLSAEKLAQEWYVRCVGKKAAPYLKAYFKVWNDYYSGEVRKTPYFKSAASVYMTYNDVSCVYALQKKDLLAAEKAMEAVVKYAQTPQEKERAALMQKHWKMTKIRLQMLGASIYDVRGNITTAEQALALLETVEKYPVIRKEYEALCQTLLAEKEIRPYYTSKPYIRAGASPLGQNFDVHISNHILKAGDFVRDQRVKAAFARIRSDKNQVESVRSLCNVLGDPATQKNLLAGGDAEKGILPHMEIHPQLRWSGTLSVTGQYKAEGKNSFCVTIKGHDTLFWIVNKAKPATTYLATFKVFIPKPSAEGYLSATLYSERNGRNQQWRNLAPLKLSGGVWQTFSTLTRTAPTGDSVRLRLYIRKFEKGDTVYFDDIKIIEIR